MSATLAIRRRSVAAVLVALLGALAGTSAVATAQQAAASRLTCAVLPAGGSRAVVSARTAGGLPSRAGGPPSAIETLEQSSVPLADALGRVAAVPSAENRTAAGDACLSAGVLDQALDQYREAVRLDATQAAAWDGMARVWRDWGMPGVALPHASRAVFYAPRSAAAHNTLGTVLQAMGQGERARTEFRRVLELEPSASYAWNNICYSFIVEGAGTRAQDACRRALAAAPSFTPARNNLALAYAVEGDVVRAEAEFAAAAGSGAKAYNLGIVYMGHGQFRAAEVAFRRAESAADSVPEASERARQARRLAEGRPEARIGAGRKQP